MLEWSIAILLSLYAATATLALGVWVDETWTHYTPVSSPLAFLMIGFIPLSLGVGPAWVWQRRSKRLILEALEWKK